MSYTREIAFRDYVIQFEYEMKKDNWLNLLGWTVYEGDTEVLIPCQVEADYIERELWDWLDNEWFDNASNYKEDAHAEQMERRASFMEDYGD